MATIITRAGKGSPLTNGEMDQNLINLNTDKVDVSGNQTIAGTKTFSSPIVGSITGNADNVAGTVAIVNGGTGQTTAANAFNALKQAASETATGVVELATASEAQSGVDTARVLTPATLRSGMNASGSAPVYACRAWVNFNGTGTVAIRASGNVSSITDNGTGDYTVNFMTAMPDANYGAHVVASDSSAASCPIAHLKWNAVAPSVNSATVRTANDAGISADSTYVCVAIFR